MKLTLALVAAFLAVCRISAVDVAPAFTIDREYKYEYKSRAVTGIPDKGIMQFSGIGIKGTVIIQNKDNKIYFKFEDVEYGNFNGKPEANLDEEFQMPYAPITGPYTFVKDALNKPVRVTMEKGLVKSFDVASDDPTWSVNVKKAILSLFQLNLDRENNNRLTKGIYLKPEDSDVLYRVPESGIGGECETVYQISSTPYYRNPTEHVLNVTKHRQYDKCTHRPITRYSTHMGYKCLQCETATFNPIKSVSHTDYQIRGDRHLYTIEKIYNSGKFIFTPFTTKSQTILSGVNQTVFLMETKGIDQMITFPSDFVTHKTLSYHMTTESKTTEEMDTTKPTFYTHPLSYTFKNFKEQVGKLLEMLSKQHQLTEDMDAENMPEKFLGLVKILSTLTYEEIMDMYNTYLDFEYLTATPEKQRMKKVFFDALTTVGTNPSIKYILYVLEKEIIPAGPASEIFDRMPFYVKRPNEKMADEFFKFTKTINKDTKRELYKTMWLAFGTIVRRGCRMNPKDVTVSHMSRTTCVHYLDEVYEMLTKTSDTWEKLLFVKVMGNMGLKENYKYLKPLINREKGCPDVVRMQAIWSLSHCLGELREEIITLASPIYFNHSETFDMRATAFEVIMYTNPSFSFIEYVGEKLHEEPCRQMASYAYSTFVALANSTNPCHFKIAKNVRTVLKMMKPLKFGYQYSRKVLLNFFNDKYAFGGETLLAWGGSNESIIPDSFFMQQSGNVFGYNYDYFSFAFEGKGLSRIYNKMGEMFDPMDESKTLFNVFRRHPRNVDTVKKEREEIKSAINITPRKHQEISGQLTFSAFNQEYKFLYFDEKNMPALKDGFLHIPKELPKMLSEGYKVNFQKMTLVADMFFEFPTEIGFPLTMSLSVPAYMTVTGNVKFDVDPGFFPEDYGFKKPTALKLTTDLKTKVHIEAIAKVALRTPIFNAYGYGMTHDVAMQIPLKLNMGYDLKEKKFHMDYTPSKQRYEMIHTTTKPFTFVDKINDYTPLSKEPNMKPIVYNHHPHEFTMKLGHKYFGAGIEVHRRQEYDWASFGSYYRFFSSFFTKKSQTFDTSKYYYNYVKRLLSGYWAMRDYFILHPTMKPYELNVYYEPSQENPTSNYVFTVDFNKYFKTSTGPYVYDTSSGEQLIKLDPSFRKVYHTHIDLVANGATTRKYHIDFNVSYPSLSNMPRKFSLDYHRTPVPNYDPNPFKLCYRASMKLPTISKFYTIDTTQEQKAEGTATIHFGKDCETDKKITITSVVEKTDQQKMYDTNPAMYYPSYKQCMEDTKQGYNMSMACWKYFYNFYTLKKYTVDVEYENLPDYFYSYMDHVSYWFKYYLYTNMKIKKQVTNPQGHLKIVANFSCEGPASLDLKVYKPTQTVYYKNIYYPYYMPFFQHSNLRMAPRDMFMKRIFGYGYTPVCRLQNDHVYTFDQVHYSVPMNPCYYIVAKDCSKEETFMLMAKSAKHDTFTKAMKLFVGNHKIEILPVTTSAPLVLRVDDVKKALTPGHLFVLPDPEHKDKFIFKIFNIAGDYTILVPSLKLKVIFNGEFLVIKPSNCYRGHLCGLCGDFNGECHNEFVGPNKCVYMDEKPFTLSYMVPDATCPVPETELTKCYYPYAHKYIGKCTLRRNKVVNDAPVDPSKAPANNMCFSTVAIPECASGCEPTTMVKSRIGFHCLNNRDPSTSTLLKDSKTRELTEFLYKSKDYYEVVEYPERCVKA